VTCCAAAKVSDNHAAVVDPQILIERHIVRIDDVLKGKNGRPGLVGC
jgi:hypothetical protein